MHSKFYFVPPDLVARVEAIAARVREKIAREQNESETSSPASASEVTPQPSESAADPIATEATLQPSESPSE